TAFRLNRQHLEELRSRIEGLLLAAHDNPDEDGVWTTFLWTAIDRQDRRPVPPLPPKARKKPGEREQTVAQNQNWGFSAGGGGLLQVLGIIYLVKILRRRRQRRELETRDSEAAS